jgi:hypothetical protein
VGVGRRQVLVLVAIMTVICGCATTERVPTALLDASADRTGTRLMVALDTCSGKPEVVDVSETTTEVRARVLSDDESGDSLGCAVALGVRLQEPLGDRVVIDDSTGDRVKVRRG